MAPSLQKKILSMSCRVVSSGKVMVLQRLLTRSMSMPPAFDATHPGPGKNFLLLIMSRRMKFVGFSPFFCTFGVGVLSGGLGAASLPSVAQTIAKVSQQRRQKKGGRAKNRPKTGGKGLAQITKLWNNGAKSRIIGLVSISKTLSSKQQSGR